MICLISDEDGISLVIFSVRNQNGESRDYVVETKNKGNPEQIHV